jgi:septal ring-binding cell division protein DamX
MANGKRGGGDMVLESRHLIGIFLLMVVISGVVFTLGYVMGRSQYYTQVRAAASSSADTSRRNAEPAPAKGVAPASQPSKNPSETSNVPPPSDWDFFRAAEPNKAAPLKPETKPGAPAKTTVAAKPAAPPAPAQQKALMNAPLVPRGAILLQVAALIRQDDALALAEALQKKKYPAFVLTPGADHYYRVQVGPYADTQSATIARRGLENEGFKTIVKR